MRFQVYSFSFRYIRACVVSSRRLWPCHGALAFPYVSWLVSGCIGIVWEVVDFRSPFRGSSKYGMIRYILPGCLFCVRRCLSIFLLFFFLPFLLSLYLTGYRLCVCFECLCVFGKRLFFWMCVDVACWDGVFVDTRIHAIAYLFVKHYLHSFYE
jgi:hypothetical protein